MSRSVDKYDDLTCADNTRLTEREIGDVGVIGYLITHLISSEGQ